MQEFRSFLQQEYLKRAEKNPQYSLRAFAGQLKISHATLSSLLSGKRKLTAKAIEKLSKALGLSPLEVEIFCKSKGSEGHAPYFLIQQDAFSSISEWYFDAILEMSLIPEFKLTPEVISEALGISELKAKIALETLERLELLRLDKGGTYRIVHQNTTNILDPDFTTAAQMKYQKAILEKSLEALENVERPKRDHTSTTIAMNAKDLPEVKRRIQNFRQELNAFLQRDEMEPDEVYQLQVSFFPLTFPRTVPFTNLNLENHLKNKIKEKKS